MSNPIKSLFNQSIIYGLSSIIPRFLNFLLVPLYTNYYSPLEYGIVADLYSWTVLLNIIVTYGMETSLMRFFNYEYENKKVYSTAFYSIFFSSLIFLTITIYFKNKIADLLGYTFNSEYIIYFSLIIFFDAVCALPFVKLRIENKPLAFAGIKITNVLINIFLNILLIVFLPKLLLNWFNINIKLDVGFIFISNLIASCITAILLIRKFPPIKFVSLSLLKKMLLYGLPLMLSGLAGSINDVIDRQFIKYFSPNNTNALEDLGIYFANVKIAVILILFIQTFRYAAEPFFFSNREKKDSRENISKIMTFFIFINFLVFLFTYGNLSIFKYYIGSEYWSGLKIVPVVLFANILVGIFLNLSVWYKLSDKTYFGILILGVGLIFTIVLDYLLVPKFGYVAAAYVRMFSYLIMIIISYFLGQYFYRINYEIMKISHYFLIFIVLYFVMKFLNYHTNHIISLIINNLFVLLLLVYFIKKEKLNVHNYVQEIKFKIRSLI